jgi:hypothetical protein
MTGGRDGQRSLAVTVSGYASGDAKWVSAPVTVKPGTRYEVSDWYLATVATSLEAVYTDGTGKQTYAWLADAPAPSAWKQATAAFTAPAGAVKVSIYHVIERNGTVRLPRDRAGVDGGGEGDRPVHRTDRRREGHRLPGTEPQGLAGRRRRRAERVRADPAASRTY